MKISFVQSNKTNHYFIEIQNHLIITEIENILQQTNKKQRKLNLLKYTKIFQIFPRNNVE